MYQNELAKALIDRLPITSDAKRRYLGLYEIVSQVKRRKAKEEQGLPQVGDYLPA